MVFTDNPMIDFSPTDLFIDGNDTVYVLDILDSRIYAWSKDSINPTVIISNGLQDPSSLFIAATGDMYVDNGQHGRVDKWTVDKDISEPVMFVCEACVDIFIDINDVLYCSMGVRHQFVAKSLHNDSHIITVVAGVGISGSESTMLDGPRGIFVDTNLDLYVADYYNDRIQLFHAEEINGITVARVTSPTSVVLDAAGYLYIGEDLNDRIVRLDSSGSRCLFGCTGGFFSSDQLSSISTIAFDSYGNMYVIHDYNERLQKIFLLNNSCGKYDRNFKTRRLL